jgi:hypothetical protein
LPVLAVKLAELCPIEIESVVGTLNALVLVDRLTCTAPVAALFSETVHVADALLPSNVGEHDKPETDSGADTFSTVLAEAEFSDAVICAV